MAPRLDYDVLWDGTGKAPTRPAPARVRKTRVAKPHRTPLRTPVLAFMDTHPVVTAPMLAEALGFRIAPLCTLLKKMAIEGKLTRERRRLAWPGPMLWVYERRGGG